MTEFTTTTTGDRVAYDRRGTGPALIFVAGAGPFRAIDPWTTETAERAAQQGITTLVFDRLGRGESPAEGRLDPRKLTEERFRHFLDEPAIPDVDLFVRSSGEQRTSNFLLWQSAYAELVFLDRLWPDFDRRDLWRAIEVYAQRPAR